MQKFTKILYLNKYTAIFSARSQFGLWNPRSLEVTLPAFSSVSGRLSYQRDYSEAAKSNFAGRGVPKWNLGTSRMGSNSGTRAISVIASAAKQSRIAPDLRAMRLLRFARNDVRRDVRCSHFSVPCCSAFDFRPSSEERNFRVERRCGILPHQSGWKPLLPYSRITESICIPTFAGMKGGIGTGVTKRMNSLYFKNNTRKGANHNHP